MEKVVNLPSQVYGFANRRFANRTHTKNLQFGTLALLFAAFTKWQFPGLKQLILLSLDPCV